MSAHSAAVASVVIDTFFVVLALTNSLHIEEAIDLTLSTGPLTHDVEHIPMAFASMFVPKSWVMKDAIHILHDTFNGDLRVFPRIQNSWGDELQYLTCDSPGRVIQDIAEVILRQHRVCRI